jgi:thiol-disulfide isomerase/thioredoxin
MKRVVVLALLFAAAAMGGARAETLPFERGSWQKLLAAHAGKPTVIHFWGLTCAPCLVELPAWGKLQASRPDLRLVLVAADPVLQDPERLQATLARAGLDKSESWGFADSFHERLRHEIDPAWSGELPRTVMIDRTGKATVLPGVADLARVRAWLDAQPKSP